MTITKDASLHYSNVQVCLYEKNNDFIVLTYLNIKDCQ